MNNKTVDELALIYKDEAIAKGTKADFQNQIKEIGKNIHNEKRLVEKLEEMAQKSLDNFINAQNFAFRRLGYLYSHNLSIAKDGTKEFFHYLINKSGDKLWQGISTISKEGTLFNVFEVSLQQQEVSTAMYKLLSKIEFEKIQASYGSGALVVNF